MLYLKCIMDSEVKGHYIKKGVIYKAREGLFPDGYFKFGVNRMCTFFRFQELSKVEAFIAVRGKMDKIQVLP